MKEWLPVFAASMVSVAIGVTMGHLRGFRMGREARKKDEADAAVSAYEAETKRNWLQSVAAKGEQK